MQPALQLPHDRHTTTPFLLRLLSTRRFRTLSIPPIARPRPPEKNLTVLKGVLEAVPSARLAFVGDGPQREELERVFAGLPVKFMVGGL
jgi:hypothetical protein